MNKLSFLVLLLALVIASCKNDSAGGKGSGENDRDTTKFFQVNQYLLSQIKEVNATPFFIYRIDITNDRKDSIPINTTAFNKLSKQFLEPDINDEKFKHYYKETIFEDQTTKGFTINYSTTNKELPLQSCDILLSEDGRTVKRVLLRKFYNYSDSSAIEQLSWKPGESFQVNRSVQKGNNETTRQTIVVWNKKS